MYEEIQLWTNLGGTSAAWAAMGETGWNFRPSANYDFPSIWRVSGIGAPGLKTCGTKEGRQSAEHRRAAGTSSAALRTHYVPVKDDLSDIEEVFDWCLMHADAAEEIALNGRKFIENFLDEPLEKEILRQVISAYLEKAPSALGFSPLERLFQRLTQP